MLDFENLDKVSNIVCRINSTLVIKHVVELKNNRPSKKNDKFSVYGFYYENKNPISKYKPVGDAGGNLMFTSNGYISIENKKNVVRNETVLSETLCDNRYYHRPTASQTSSLSSAHHGTLLGIPL